MEMKSQGITVFSALTALFLSSCADNPADNVSKASVESVSTESEASAATPAEPAEVKTFVLSDTSKIEWVGSKVTGSHNGGFNNFVGKFEVADSQLVPGGKHFVTVDMASVFSDNPKLTEHLKTADFFDVEKFPIARFQLKEAVLKEGNQYDISGILDMHGVAKKITFPATLEFSGKETLLDMEAEFAINRQDFGISFPGKPDDLIRDEVVMKFDVSALPGEPQELVLLDKTEPAPSEEGRRERGKGDFGKGKGRGKGEDWRNMSEEERAERRRQFMEEMDKNKDGQLGKDEVPERMWNFMGRADKDGDDRVSREEGEAFRAEMRAQMELRELTGEGGFPGRGPGGGKGPPGGGRRDSE